jgi:hypothetical protein
VLVIGLAMAGGWATWDRASAADGATSDAPTTSDPGGTTSSVERRDLVTREEYDGSLGYTGERAVMSRRQGTLTWAVSEGSIVQPGAVLFRVDTAPVFYLAGGQPAWRTLEDGVDDGLDVQQLETNLVALGYDPDHDVAIDTEFDWATEDAVQRWQEATHQDDTGRVELGTVVFLPGPSRRVATVDAGVGTAVGGRVLSTTSTRREASFELSARDAGLVAAGKAVQVELPDGTTVRGRIRQVGRVAASGTDDGSGGSTDPTIEVTVRLDAAKGIDAFDQAPVTVRVETESVRDALAVPIGALLATAGGGYALEVVEGTARRLVRVDVGAFADGYVQVTGAGVKVGTKVMAAEL